MTRNERKVLHRTILLGVVLTLFVIVLDGVSWLDPLEHYLYDYRARDCQYFTPPPTDRFVHLDIDDPTLQEIGWWPWPRAKLAEIVDEVQFAGAKVLGMDVLFADPQPQRWLAPDDDGKSHSIDDDHTFAQSVKKANNVLLPFSLDLDRIHRSPIYVETVNQLLQNLELNADEVIAKLRGSPLDSRNMPTEVKDIFILAREEAMFRRIDELVSAGMTDPAALHDKLTPVSFKRDLKTDAGILLDHKLPEVLSVRSEMRFTIPIPSGMPPIVVSERESATLIPELTDAIHYSGYVDFIKAKDGVVRNIPLFVNYRGRLLPHMALAEACAILDVDLSKVEFTSNTVTLPLPTGERIIIPVHALDTPEQGRVGMFMDVPWFGTKEWRYAFDYPNHQDSKQHIPLNTVWRICELRRDLESLDSKIDDALKGMLQVYSTSLPKTVAFIKQSPEERTREKRIDAIKEVLEEVGPLIDLSTYDKMKPSEYNADEKLFVPAYQALTHAQRSYEIDTDRINSARAALRGQLNGRAALIGFTATGKQDTYTTSLHEQAPGVVVHGMVVNGILTRDLYIPMPWWQTAIITLVIGVIVTFSVGYLSPSRAMFCTIGLMVLYFVINGIVLFDFGKMIYGAAAPLTTAFLVWSTLTLVRFVSEQIQKQKIKHRLGSYIDPRLVDYCMENLDDNSVFAGQVRLMSVVFTDLAGFTSISEQLREGTVPLLNDYMSRMLPIIRENQGVWNKFLGDGIMFFFGAPQESPTHARDAVATVLQMIKAVETFNCDLREKGLPLVAMRAGISTGPMIVGDAGSKHPVHQAADYTVLGDEVNLGARLESANKYLGSRLLMNDLAAQLCGDEFLLRPVGNICVKGKTEGVLCYEPICLMSEATDEQKRFAKLSEDVVENFCRSNFDACVAAIDQIVNEFGASRFTDLYQSLSRLYVAEPPGEKFDGQIVLAEK